MLRKTALAHSLLLAFSGTAVLSAVPAFAQDKPVQELQRVEVTGTSIKRIDAETALPVQVITREEIQKTGASNVEQLMQTISSMSSSGGMAAASASGATTGGISSISLHGLTSVRTLVLVNGRRISPYGVGFTNDAVSVDVNSIPLAAIERVEVLQDGASAIYGSDAIAGVVNFILRRDFTGVELTGEYGDTTRGGASLKRGSATVGFGDFAKDRYNVMMVASLQREGSLIGEQRDFAKSGISVEHQNDVTSGNTFPANIAAADGSFGTRNPSRPTGCLLPYSQVDPLLSTATACRFDPSPMVTLIPKSDRVSLLASGRLALGGDWEAFAEASYNQNKIRTIIQPVPLSDQFTLPDNNPLFNLDPYNGFATILLKSSSPYYPTAYVTGITGGATPDLLVRYRAALSGNRDFTDISSAPRFVIGARGSAAGWDLESSLLYSSSTVREQVNGGYPIYSKILPLLNSGNVNFFGDNTPDIVSQVQAANFTGDAFKVKSSVTSLQAKGSREIFKLPGGPAAVAVGAEVRKETYNFQSSTELQQGDVSGYGGNFLPIDKSRNVTAGFAELNLPIVKSLEANLAVRYDHYEGVGNSTTPKLGLRWQPATEFLVRSSVGKGFRAPSLADLYSANTQSVSPTGLSDPLRCPTTGDGVKDCSTQFGVLFGGNANLKPEKSKNFTLGFVLQPTSNVSMSVDYFKVRLSDTIVNGVDAATILDDPVKYASLITRGPVDPAFPNLPGPIISLNETNINLGGSKVGGLELGLNWKLPAGDLGKFTVSMNGTYFIQYDTQNLDGTYTGNVDQPNGSTGGVIPRWKHYLTVDWTRGPWNVSISQQYQKGYHDGFGSVEDDSGTPRDVGPYISYDAQASYSGFKNWKFTLGVRNLFDRDPPYVNVNAAFQVGYDPQYADPRGRFIYGRATYAF
jgi:iron complex outermembrane receptor protein